MAAPKGKVMNPKGRGRVPSKTTVQSREAIARFVDKNTPRLNKWLDEIAEDSPKDAFNCFWYVVIIKNMQARITA